jgi:hypothetical protein
MFANVAACDLIRDAPITKRGKQPVKDLGCIALGYGIKDTGFLHVSADII